MFLPYTFTLASGIQNEVLYLLTKKYIEGGYSLMLPKTEFHTALASILHS